MNFGGALKSTRLRRGGTLKDMSEAVGLSIGYLSDIEHSRKRPPSLAVVEKIESFLHTRGLVELANRERRAGPKSLRMENIKLREALTMAREQIIKWSGELIREDVFDYSVISEIDKVLK